MNRLGIGVAGTATLAFVLVLGFAAAATFVSCENLMDTTSGSAKDDPLNLGGASVPDAPMGVVASRSQTTVTTVTVSWNAVSGATSYTIYSSSSENELGIAVASPVTTSYTSTGHNETMTFYFRVSAVNSAGEGAPSAPVTVGPAQGEGEIGDNGTQGLAFMSINNGTAYRVSKGTVTSGAVVIPAANNRLPVRQVATLAFSQTDITSVSIPYNVTSIGQLAFYQCGSLASVALPESLKSIEYSAFANCVSITSLTIPAGVTSVGYQAFAGWTGTQTIYLRGHASEASANAAWNSDWRNSCGALIVYGDQ